MIDIIAAAALLKPLPQWLRPVVQHACSSATTTFRTNSRTSAAAAVRRRSTYERSFRKLIERGAAEGVFDVRSARLASYSILDMGMGVANWFHDGGEFSVEQLAYQYGDLALRLVGCRA